MIRPAALVVAGMIAGLLLIEPARLSQAIAQGDVQAINYFVAQKYVEALREFASSPNQKVFMMPVESAGLLGARGGIAELAKDAMTKQPSGPQAPPPRPRVPQVGQP